MQVSAHNGPVRYAFQAGHEGSIPFARSSPKPQVKVYACQSASSRHDALPFLRARCVPLPRHRGSSVGPLAGTVRAN